ncbi:MAG TPA: hypothetical protein VJH68_04515 [Candidatus Nanoarchaeia archaeon]|nr:hypothetical protein [Candidatus Nanoarchaeia archaeon]
MGNKQASADIWWIIIGAVIALVVLIIITVIFTGRTSILNQELGECRSKGGICMPVNDNCPGRTLPTPTFSCGEVGRCCIGAPKACTDGEDCQLCVVDVNSKRWCA